MKDWWRGSVTYQIYPRSFQDDNADGVGDLKGIARRLPHVARLGVDAIWLSPIFTSPMDDMGYDVSDYRGVDPTFGTLADFDELVRIAHDLGLKVIIDQVLSHSSDRHPFFQESRRDRTNPRADWYVWADARPDGTPPNNWLAIFGGGAWQWEPRRKQYYLHNFLATQPDFNFHNPEVQAWHLDNMRFWLERGVDGFRLDTVNFYFHDAMLRDNPADFRRKAQAEWNPYDMQYHLFSKNQPENIAFLERMRALLDEFDGRAMVGEVGESHHAIEMMGQYTSGRRLQMAYSFEFLGPAFSAAHFRSRVAEFYEKAPNGWPCWAFSNHDVRRHVSRWAPHGVDRETLAKQACALLTSLEGSLCIYQGEELGQTETDLEYWELTDPQGLNFWPENKGRDGCRTPMVWEAEAPNAGFSAATPWLPVKQPQAANAVSTQAGVQGSVLEFYREQLHFRRGSEALKSGRTRFHDAREPLLVFSRGPLLCVFNLSTQSVALEVAQAGPAMRAMNARIAAGRVDLGPNGFVILDGGAPAAQP